MPLAPVDSFKRLFEMGYGRVHVDSRPFPNPTQFCIQALAGDRLEITAEGATLEEAVGEAVKIAETRSKFLRGKHSELHPPLRTH